MPAASVFQQLSRRKYGSQARNTYCCLRPPANFGGLMDTRACGNYPNIIRISMAVTLFASAMAAISLATVAHEGVEHWDLWKIGEVLLFAVLIGFLIYG